MINFLHWRFYLCAQNQSVAAMTVVSGHPGFPTSEGEPPRPWLDVDSDF